MIRWEVYEDQAGEWRWRALARNGRVLADSAEGYATRRNAKRALSGFQEAVRDRSREPVAALAERCACEKPALSKSVTNLCTACGRLRG